jgi:disulfide bond formation protein DsbB
MAAIGLAASSFLSFPVAAFFSLTMLILVFSSGSMAASVEEGTIMGVDHETNAPSNPVIDAVMLPVFKGMLAVVNLARSFSPVESLSTGRSIPWETLGLAFVQVVLLLGGVFAAVGMIVLSRRELATAQGTS